MTWKRVHGLSMTWEHTWIINDVRAYMELIVNGMEAYLDCQ